ncbi:hypothetical protein [Photobacterium minamisatsumaniensis]|uniref:hypothetical protein n=1 Tax=Photobacterium minamisatsumaniensis TaxID=2910233 RepID=UPI003D0CC7AD
MDAETFRLIAQGVQAIAITLATLFGGAWAVFKIYSSRELDKSRSEAIKLERELNKKSGFYGDIDIDVGNPVDDKSIPVFFTITIENNTTETHTLDWNGYPLKIASVIQGSNEYRLSRVCELQQIHIKPVGCDYYHSHSTSKTMFPHSKHRMYFYWNCEQDDIYLACISAPLPKSIIKYIHDSDQDNKISEVEIEQKNNDNYEHDFDFFIERFFQVKV